MVIAIDSTLRGPALGGCRWRPYPDSLVARREACALAASMTRKAALARLSLGGGKAVVIGDPAQRTREQLFAFGDFVESLGGCYITAADMGTGEEQMGEIHERTRFVVGLPRELGGCGDPGPFTARGVYMAIVAALGGSVTGARVAVQGVGSVGAQRVKIPFPLPALARILRALTSNQSGGGSMANASQVRAALGKELARLRKALERLEARLKSTADDVTTGAPALEKVLEKEIAPNVSAGLKVIEKELARLTKSYDRELAKLRKAKARVEKKVTKSKKAKPAPKARAKAKSAAKPAARKTAAAPKRAKPAAKKAARKAPAKKTAARKAPAKKATRKTVRRAKKPAAKRSART